jgi:O-antigen/teichoic acid export membrane protein
MNDDTVARAQLGDAALRSARWVTLGRIAAETIALLGTVVLARLLTPAEFGHAAVANFVYALALAIPSIGFSSQIVRAERVDPRLVQTAMLLSLAVGALLTVLVWVLTPLLEIPFGAQTAELIALAAPTFLILSAGAVSQALLQRRLDFRRISLNDILGLVPGVIVSIACAALGVGAASLIIGILVNATISTALAIASAPPPHPRLDRAHAHALTSFGVPATLSSLLYVAFRNVDYAILGARLNPAQVGLYWRGYQLGVEYQGKISGILLRVALPVFSRATSAEDLRRMRSRIVRLHAVLIFPLLALLASLAPVFVPWLYGSQWTGAVVPTQILTVAGAATAVNTGIGPLLLAIGRAKELMVASAIIVTVYAAVVWVSAPHGITTVCAVVAGMQVIALMFQQYFLVERLAGIRLLDTLRNDVVPPGLASAALITVAWPLTRFADDAGLPALVVLAVAAAAGTAIYVAVLRLVFPAAWSDVRAVVARILPRLRPSAARADARERSVAANTEPRRQA